MTAPVAAPPIAIPADQAGILDTLSDPAKFQTIAAGGPDSFKAFSAAVAAEFAKRDKGAVEEQIAVEAQRIAIQAMRDAGGDGVVKRLNHGDPRLAETHAKYASMKKGTAYNRYAPGAQIEDDFTGTVDFLRSVWHKNTDPTNVAKLAQLRAKITNAFGSTVPSDGGFLIPEQLRANLLSIALEQMVVRPRATVIPMDSLRVPFPILDSTTNVGSVFGGMIAYWTEESVALTESAPKFGKVMLEAQKLTGFSALPNELLQDSIISLVALVEEKWPQALAFFEDLGFHSGTGVGEPLGYLGNPATVVVAKESGQPAATLVWENLLEMYARLLPSSLARSVWFYTPAALRQLGTMALSVGTGGAPVWLNNGVDGPPARILGQPAYPCEKLSALGTQGDLTFVDLSYYMIGDRQMMQIESSEHYLFGSDKTAFRIIQRVDGRPWIQSAITPANGGPTLSPFVELATRA